MQQRHAHRPIAALRAPGLVANLLCYRVKSGGYGGGIVLEGTVSYVAFWLNGLEIVAEDEFEDLLEAKAFILDHLQENREHFGVTAVRVCDDHATYFLIE